MKKRINNTWLVFLLAFTLLVFTSSCKKKYDYHIKGTVVKATTQKPLEGVVVEVYNEICQGGLFSGGCGPDPDDFHSTTTNEYGEFEMVIMSEESALHLNFKKEFMYKYFNGTDYIVYPSSTTLNLDMFVQPEEFTIEFEPSLPNMQEVTLGFEWNYFQGRIPENVIWGTFPSHFAVFDRTRKPTSLGYYGEQWLKMNFDMLLEDGSRLQKTDSIWLPGRYYDINDYDFGDPRKYPVYKFTY